MGGRSLEKLRENYKRIEDDILLKRMAKQML